MSDKSSVGGPEHVCGVHCDGQDRGGGCCVQDKFYGTKFPYTSQPGGVRRPVLTTTGDFAEKLKEVLEHGKVRELTFDAFRRANVERCEKRWHLLKEYTPCDWMTCLIGELGELASEIKKLRRGEDVPHEKFRHEIGDVQAYLDLLAASLDVDLGEATVEKFNIVSDRAGSGVKL